MRLDDIFACIRQLAGTPPFAGQRVPLVGMTSYTLVHRRGPEAFLAQAQAAGFSGAIVPDLPVEEAEELARLAADRDFKLIQLVTPLTPRDRAVRIARLSTGFLYYVSVTGITGERERLPDELVSQLGWLRNQTDLPICVASASASRNTFGCYATWPMASSSAALWCGAWNKSAVSRWTWSSARSAPWPKHWRTPSIRSAPLVSLS